ncbi:MAG: HigA family addiction module antidote protein [Zoogloeaceae bacterium]|jgi:addiction module HigA family antidote|nr:HigA family addiction module antidote protein [Zoogloeaceae bacterium]
MTLKNPTHPGEVLREDVILALGLTVTEAAERLGMSRTALSRVLNCRAAVSIDLALRLEQAGVSTADTWLTLQLNYDLAQTRSHPKPGVRAFCPATVPA